MAKSEEISGLMTFSTHNPPITLKVILIRLQMVKSLTKQSPNTITIAWDMVKHPLEIHTKYPKKNVHYQIIKTLSRWHKLRKEANNTP